jgi:hypothetical protein
MYGGHSLHLSTKVSSKVYFHWKHQNRPWFSNFLLLISNLYLLLKSLCEMITEVIQVFLAALGFELTALQALPPCQCSQPCLLWLYWKWVLLVPFTSFVVDNSLQIMQDHSAALGSSIGILNLISKSLFFLKNYKKQDLGWDT